MSSTGHLEASTALYRAYLERLLGRTKRTPEADLHQVEAQAREAEFELQRLVQQEPSAHLGTVLRDWNAARHELAQVATQRLDDLHLPPPEAFPQLVGDACATLELEFDRPVRDWSSLLIIVFPTLGLVFLALKLVYFFEASAQRFFSRADLLALAVAFAWYLRARWRRARVAEKRVRLTIFGVHAHGAFLPFADIASGWLGPRGEVVLETKEHRQVRLETLHAVELQQALRYHGVGFVRRGR